MTFFSCLNKTCFTQEFSHSNNRAWPSIVDFILTIFHWSLSTCTQELRPQTISEIIRKPETDATNDGRAITEAKNKNNFTAWRVVYRNLHWSWRHILSTHTSLPDLIGNFLDCLPYILYDVSSDNLLLDQQIIPLFIVFVILTTCLFDIVLILWGEILSWSLKGVRELNEVRIDKMSAVNPGHKKFSRRDSRNCLFSLRVFQEPYKITPALLGVWN